jgi:hypothetical protein
MAAQQTSPITAVTSDGRSSGEARRKITPGTGVDASANRRPGQGSQTALRERNLGLVRQVLAAHGSLTQVQIAHNTGLSPATVSNLVVILNAHGEVLCTQTIHSGRRAKRVELLPTA